MQQFLKAKNEKKVEFISFYPIKLSESQKSALKHCSNNPSFAYRLKRKQFFEHNTI